MALTAQFGLAAILLAILALREPPNTITVVVEYFGVGCGRFNHMGGANECRRGVLWGQRPRGPNSD